jgi:hypothetical protein
MMYYMYLRVDFDLVWWSCWWRPWFLSESKSGRWSRGSEGMNARGTWRRMEYFLFADLVIQHSNVETNINRVGWDPWGSYRKVWIGASYINPDGNDKYYRKINIDIETRIYSGSRTDLLIMISITRNQRAGLIPHLLTSGLIPSLLMSISWVNWFPTRNKSGSLIAAIMIFLLYLWIPAGSNPVETN